MVFKSWNANFILQSYLLSLYLLPHHLLLGLADSSRNGWRQLFCLLLEKCSTSRNWCWLSWQKLLVGSNICSNLELNLIQLNMTYPCLEYLQEQEPSHREPAWTLGHSQVFLAKHVVWETCTQHLEDGIHLENIILQEMYKVYLLGLKEMLPQR